MEKKEWHQEQALAIYRDFETLAEYLLAHVGKESGQGQRKNHGAKKYKRTMGKKKRKKSRKQQSLMITQGCK